MNLRGFWHLREFLYGGIPAPDVPHDQGGAYVDIVQFYMGNLPSNRNVLCQWIGVLGGNVFALDVTRCGLHPRTFLLGGRLHRLVDIAVKSDNQIWGNVVLVGYEFSVMVICNFILLHRIYPLEHDSDSTRPSSCSPKPSRRRCEQTFAA